MQNSAPFQILQTLVIFLHIRPIFHKILVFWIGIYQIRNIDEAYHDSSATYWPIKHAT